MDIRTVSSSLEYEDDCPSVLTLGRDWATDEIVTDWGSENIGIAPNRRPEDGFPQADVLPTNW